MIFKFQIFTVILEIFKLENVQISLTVNTENIIAYFKACNVLTKGRWSWKEHTVDLC